MKSSLENKYSDISTFEDFRLERERLIFRSRLIETKLNLTYLQLRKMFSVSNLFFSFAKETVLPKIADYLGDLIQKVVKENAPVPDNDQEGEKERVQR